MNNISSVYSIISVISFICALCVAIRVETGEYKYDDEKIIIETGAIKRKQRAILLERIDDVVTTKNIMNYGNIIIKEKGRVAILYYVSNPLEVAEILRNKIINIRNKKNLVLNDVI